MNLCVLLNPTRLSSSSWLKDYLSLSGIGQQQLYVSEGPECNFTPYVMRIQMLQHRRIV